MVSPIPKNWNTLLADLKSAKNINSFRHKIKDKFCKDLQTLGNSPTNFIKILKAVTQLPVNNLENAAFFSTFDIKMIYSFLHRHFSP